MFLEILQIYLLFCNSFAEIKVVSRDVERLNFVKVIGAGLSPANIDNVENILQPSCPILDLVMLKNIIEVLYAVHSIHVNAPLLLFMVCDIWIIWIQNLEQESCATLTKQMANYFYVVP